ncbi:unnamed protein product [Linum trigynum]|uniref:Uncharacterized protein n=1 Tax=Linum trigynum TaxID=586398 RepID=A0AAV2EDG2_9ROSI
MVLNNAQLHPAVTFSNKVFRKDKENSRLLRRLGVDLHDKVTLCNIHDDLKAQHVCARLDANTGPSKPVTGLGGEHINDGGGASSSRIREEDEVFKEPEENDDIYDYDPPPEYPF